MSDGRVGDKGDAIDLTVVVPAYNEAACLRLVLEDICRALHESPIAGWEVLVVDDGSNDATAALAEQIGAANPRVRVIRHASNRGQGAALSSGFDAARGEICTWLPADGQIPAREAIRVWQAMANADFVTTHYRQRDDGLVRTVLSTGLSTLIWATLGVWAFAGGIYGFRRSLWQRHPARTSTMLTGVEFRYRLRQAEARTSIRYRDLMIDCMPRVAGTSKSANLRTIGRTFEALLRIRIAS